MSKVLKNISVTYTADKVGLSFQYENSDDEKFLLPAHVAEALRDRLSEALELVAESSHLPGSDVGLSDHAAVKILNPKGVLQ